MQITEFIKTNGITLQASHADANPSMTDGANMDHWRVTMRMNGRKMTLYYSMGRGHEGREPTADDVLACLQLDAYSINNARDFADWCGEYGFDTDSRKAHKTYTICKRQAERLAKFMGAKFDQFMTCEE